MNLPEDFAFLNDANIYLSPECYRIAKKLRLLGLKLTIAPKPKVDIWHTAYWTPIKIKGAIRVSTIHDIIFLNNPIIKKSFKNSRFYKNIFAQRVRDTIHDSNMVLCDSEQTKKELIYLLDVNPDKLFVNYPPVVFKDNVIPQDTLLNRLMSFDLKYGQYILFIGTALHKNLKRLVEAYLSLSIDIPLVIIGKPKSAYIFVELNKAIFDKRIRILDYVSEADKYVLYKGAMFLAFPSLYEGCGYPPIEAMSVGVPVLTSSVSCMPEVSGDAALYVDPYDVKDIVNKITMMINDKELRQRFIEAGYERAKFFSMDNFKKGLKTAYSKL
jgi:glycosyltransferase involved in cell wall biosynthesis